MVRDPARRPPLAHDRYEYPRPGLLRKARLAVRRACGCGGGAVRARHRALTPQLQPDLAEEDAEDGGVEEQGQEDAAEGAAEVRLVRHAAPALLRRVDRERDV